jgi:hypothetical protein
LEIVRLGEAVGVRLDVGVARKDRLTVAVRVRRGSLHHESSAYWQYPEHHGELHRAPAHAEILAPHVSL